MQLRKAWPRAARESRLRTSAQKIWARSVERLKHQGLDCTGEVVDVTRKDQIAAAAEHAARSGSLDIVVANAGISAGPGPMTELGTIEAVQPERWSQVLDINLNGVFATLQVAAKHMKPQRSGRIIVTASTAGFRGDPNGRLCLFGDQGLRW